MACLHSALTEQERDDMAEAAERVMTRVADSGEIRSIDEYVDMVVEEAEAIERRREMAVVKTCPHCQGVLP